MYRVGVIGLGRVAYQLEDDPLRGKPCTHIGSWQREEGVKIVAACDCEQESRNQFSKRYPDITVYSDYRDMLDSEGLDFVSVCAYAPERSRMVIDSSNAGVKGIWCEKAMACSIREARAIQSVLAENNTKMIVSYIRRWVPRYKKVKQLIDEGAVGELQSISAHFSGNMFHTGTHAFDLMRLYGGEVDSVQAWLDIEYSVDKKAGYQYPGADNNDDLGGFGIMHFKNGIAGVVHGHNKQFFRFELELLGDKGMIRVGNTQEELWTIFPSTYSQGLKELDKAKFPEVDDNSDWELAVKNLISAVVDDEPIVCDVNDGLAAIEIALGFRYSHFSKNNKIRLQEIPCEMEVLSR